MPLLLIWSRPEQPILLAVTAALILWWLAQKDQHDTPTGMSWARSTGIVILAVIAVSYHFKALLLLPVFLICIVSASRGPRAHVPRLVSGAVLCGAVVMAGLYWVHRLQCLDDPILNAVYAHHSLGAQLTQSGDWVKAALLFLSNLNLGRYVTLAAPAAQPMSQWLLPDQVSKGVQTAWRVGLVVIWLIVLSVSVFAFVRSSANAMHRRMLDWRAAMALVIFGSTTAWCATQTVRNVYEASFVLPLLMLSFLFALASGHDSERLRRSLTPLALTLGILALVSQVLTFVTYGPSLRAALTQTGFVAGQEHSVAVLGYAREKPDILGAARQCNLSPDHRASNLLLDELTYFAFMRSSRPQFRLGVLGLWKGSIADPIAYLQSRGSDGAVVSCHFLPPDLLAKARRQGEFCCLGGDNW